MLQEAEGRREEARYEMWGQKSLERGQRKGKGDCLEAVGFVLWGDWEGCLTFPLGRSAGNVGEGLGKWFWLRLLHGVD